MKDSLKVPWALIAKYLKGETSVEEKKRLFTWLNEKPEHKALFNQLSNLWNATGRHGGDKEAETFTPDVGKGWEKFQRRTDWPGPAKSEAAADVSTSDVTTLDVSTPDVSTPVIKPLWPKSSPFVRQVTRVAAAILLLLGTMFWLRFYFTDNPPPTLTQASGEGKRVVYLPDSSRVYLNKHSYLSYAEGFKNGNRVVNLTGEAFFEVRKAAGKPFTIYSGNAQTVVLGTSFNVRAYPGEPKVEVQVVTGKVAFSSRQGKNNQRVLLTPGHRAELTRQNVLSEGVVEDDNLMAWKSEKLEFNGTPLSDVLASLERYFGVTFNVENPRLLDCRYTGSYEHPDLSGVLEVLRVSMNVSYTRKGQVYTLSGPGCP